MSLVDINGVQISFPFTPYPCQVDYMSKVLTCLQKNQNGVLESPTGTGKTLSLLCASLAWQESRKAQVEFNKRAGVAAALSSSCADSASINQLAGSLQAAAGSSWGSEEFLVPRIIYASRTHSQLSQAVQELKRTKYSSVKTSVIGSREQMCIHQQVQKLTSNSAKVHMCRSKVLARQCHFYNNIEDFKKKDPRSLIGNAVDIEDIVRVGHKIRTCPYYMARELKADSDIVFMPYNYLLDNKSRKAHGVELQGSVIIFDEAHNLEKICEESASFDLSSMDLATAIEETTKLAEKIAEMSSAEPAYSQVEDAAIVPEFNLEDIIRLKQTLLELEEKLENVDIPSGNRGKTMDGSFIFDMLSQVNITWSTKNMLLDKLDRMITFLSNDGGNSILNTKGAGLSKVTDCLKIVFSQEPLECMTLTTHQRLLSQYFKVHVQMKDNNGQYKKKVDSWSTSAGSEKKERILSYWCFSPGHAMKDLIAHGVKVIILTSGTLSPLDSFAMEMQIPFPVRLENPHVIQKEQVFLGTVCKGPDGTTLNSEYKNRSNEDYLKSLGNTIRNFARIVPSGLLVFFPSYPLMDLCIEKWKATNQWNGIIMHKPVIVEPKGKTAFNEAMEEFYEKVTDPALNGAIFMAVCRGKVSEGLDFADTNGRAVIITGLPFPPLFDARVRLKMEFLRDHRSQFQGLDGNAWYKQQATRAVNQAIGRVIRHNKDYGAIILCDTRFASDASKNSLPMWVRNQAQVYNNFGPALRDAIKFFKEAEKSFPVAMSDPVSGKGRKKDQTGIVSGVCFEPSFSRTSHGRGHVSVEYEQASAVACHIPSLRADTNDTDSIREQYTHPENVAKAGRKRTLLEALEDVELQTQSHKPEPLKMLDSQIPSYQVPKKKLPGKQKKIRIKQELKTDILISDSGQAGLQEVNKVKNKMSLESSQNYVSQVKSELPSKSYQRFSEALVRYQRERQIHDMIPVLADLFTSSEHNYHLFQKFYRFVRPDDKPYYARTCFELTGLSCEEGKSQAKQDTSLEKGQGEDDARNKTSASTSSPGPSAVSQHITSNTVGSTSDQEFRGSTPCYKDEVSITVLKQFTDGRVHSKTRDIRTFGPAPHPVNQRYRAEVWDSRNMLEPFQYDDTKLYDDLVQKGVFDPKDEIFTREMFVYPKTWKVAASKLGIEQNCVQLSKDHEQFSKCIICQQKPEQGLRHCCGAVCCFKCWKTNIFEGPPERRCPFPHCNIRVKRKHLEHVRVPVSLS